MTQSSSLLRSVLAVAVLLPASSSAAAQAAPVARDALGDPLPDGAVARLGTRRLRHETDVLDVAFTSDGSRLWSLDIGGGLRLWDAASGALVRGIDVGGAPLRGFSLPADGSRIVISREGGGATVLDPATGAVQLDLEPHGSRAVISPDGHWLAAWGPPYSKVELLSAADGAPRQTLNEKVNDFFDVAFSPDGTLLAIAGERKVSTRETMGVLSLRDTATGAVVRTQEENGALPGSLAFSPDGRRLAVGDDHGHIRVVDVRSGDAVVSAAGFDVPVRGLCWSPDGRSFGDTSLNSAPPKMGVGLDGFSLRDGSSLALLHEAIEHSAGVSALAFSPDGHRVASACRDHLVRLWDVASGARQLAPAGHETGLTALAASADGALLLTAGNDGGLGTWNTRTFALQHMQRASDLPVLAVACTPDGRLAVASGVDGSVTLRMAASGEDRGGWPGDPAHALQSLAFLPDGHTLVSAEQDGKVRLRDLSAALAAAPPDAAASAALAKPLRELDSGGALAFSVAVSPDGKLIASGASRLRLFDAATGALVHDIKGTSPIAAIAFSPDGALVATANADRTVRLYDVATGAARGVLAGHPGRVHAVAFSRDGLTLASAGEGETIVRLWDVAQLAPAGQLAGHVDDVTALVAAGPGLLASASDDGVAYIWHLPARGGPVQPGG